LEQQQNEISMVPIVSLEPQQMSTSRINISAESKEQSSSSNVIPLSTDIYTPLLEEATKEEIQKISVSVGNTKSSKQKRHLASISTTSIDDYTVATGISNDSTVITSNRSELAKKITKDQQDIEDGLEDELDDDDDDDTDEESTIAEDDLSTEKKKVRFSDELSNSETKNDLKKQKSS
jgi:hypothetical protein